MKRKVVVALVLQLITLIYTIFMIIEFNKYYFHGRPIVITMIFMVLLNIFLFIITLIMNVIAFRQSKYKVIIPSGTVIAWTLLAIILPFFITVNRFNNMVSYTREKWLTVDEKYKYYMAKDFLNDHNVNDLNETQIKSYLGEPDYYIVESSSTILQYNVGSPVRHFAIDPYILSFTIENDKIVAYSLMEH